MTAQEMFEELGYKKDARNLFLDWHKIEDGNDIEITFDLISKTFYTVLDFEPLDIDMPLLKAINQQCKELGWLDD